MRRVLLAAGFAIAAFPAIAAANNIPGPKPKAAVLTMPPMGGGRLNDDQLVALAAYLVSLR